MVALGGIADVAEPAAQLVPVENDPKRTFQLFSRHPPRCISVGGDLASNNLDVTAQIIELVGKGWWTTDVADGLLNALDFGLLLTQLLVHRAVERGLQSLELGVPIRQTPSRDPIVSHRQKAGRW